MVLYCEIISVGFFLLNYTVNKIGTVLEIAVGSEKKRFKKKKKVTPLKFILWKSVNNPHGGVVVYCCERKG